MKHFAKIFALGSMIAGSALHAQTTTQETVIGASGDPVYSVQIVGANGVVYNCLPDLVVKDGLTVRQCRRVGSGGSVTLDGTGPAAIAAGLVLVAVISADDSTD
ncbi:hypothetical protein [Stappia sp.]|uniref:hypothetical protein n=1 Tax=Stappia sp. TaxID=1870903 RepID=UPI003A99400D